MRDAFTSLPGAIVSAAEPGDEPTGADRPRRSPLHYGEPVREQRLLESGAAVVDRGDRSIIAVSGEDRLTWLDSITSQAVARLAPRESAELLVLDPHGRVEHAAGIVDDGETAWLLVDADSADALSAWLQRMVFRSRVDVAVRSDLVVVGAIGAGGSGAAETAIAADALVVWRDPWTGVLPGGVQYAAAGDHPGAALDALEAIVTPEARDRIAAAVADGSLAAAGLWAAEALRIAAWRPRWSTEVDEKTIPHELDWLRTAVHLDKGCYRGQETVAKVHNLGHPPRRIVFLHLDGSDGELPEPGAVVRADGKDVGVVTSAARHHEQGPIALAVVRRSTAADAELTVDGPNGPLAASAETIVPADAGAAAGVPRLPRLSARSRG